MITLTDETQIEYHASFNFPRLLYLKMKLSIRTEEFLPESF
jgi:hypothetical protein